MGIRRRSANRTTAAAAVFAVCLTAVALAAAPGARAAFSSSHFSYGNSNCTNHVDPITIVFYGYTAFYLQSRNIVQIYTGWSGDNSTSQYASSHGVCSHMDGESYTKCSWPLPICNRYHIRYNQARGLDSLGRYETVGTPHQDKVSWSCGVGPHHVARNYTGVRNYIHSKLRGYKFYWQYWGNTERQKQCDGSYVSSDGWVLWQRVD
jgi:hypothetical protein